jgi:DNA-binding SARP family transcriptional activator/predicted ATPase
MNDVLTVASDAAPITIHVLGGFSVFGERGRGLGAAEGRSHVRALLALLAASPDGIARDTLADALWPQQSDSGARNRLHHTLHLARLALSALAWEDDWVVLRMGRLELDERIYCDARALQRAAAGGPQGLGERELMSLLDGCRGEFAPELEGGGLAHVLRQQVREQYSQLLREAARRQAQHGDTPLRRQVLSRLLDSTPTDEWAYQQVMSLDLGAGRRHAVLRTFEQAGRALAEQLGLKPSPQLTSLALEASQGIDSEAANARDAAGSALVGREPLLREWLQRMRTEPGPWSLCALPGMGKTSMAGELARRLGPTMADGVVQVALGAQSSRPALVTIAAAAGLQPRTPDDAAEALADWLGTREVLLVLDDLDAAAQWHDVLASLPAPLRCTVLAITHLPLPAPWRVLALPPLALPRVGAPLAEARQSPALMLFDMRRPDSEPMGDDECAQAAELVRQLDGLPLAIELAAARTATMTAGEVLRGLRRGLLASPTQQGLPMSPQSRSVQATLDWTVSMLGARARAVYLAASVFNADFDRQALAALAADGAADVEDGATQEAIEELLRAGLIEATDERLRMLHLPRAHAQARAQQQGHWQELQGRRIAQLVSLLGTEFPGLESPDGADWLRRAYPVAGEVHALLPAAFEIDPSRAVSLVRALAEFANVHGEYIPSAATYDKALAAAQASSNDDAVVHLHMLAAGFDLGNVQGPVEAHVQWLVERLQTPSVTWLPAVRARAVMVAVRHLRQSDRAVPARALLDEALARTPVDQPGFWTLYVAALESGLPVDWPAHLMPGMPLLNMLRARLTGSHLWRVLLAGMEAGAELDAEALLAIAQEMLAATREVRAVRSAVVALMRKQSALLKLDRLDDARANALEWLRLSRGSANDSRMVWPTLWLAELAWRQGDTPAAARWLADGRAQAESKWPARVHHFSLMAAGVELLQGNAAAARLHYLRVPRALLEDLQSDALEAGVEAGALLARHLGLADLAGSLTRDLGLCVEQRRAPLPMRVRFRRTHLGVQPQPMDAAWHAQRGPAIARARENLAALHDYLRMQAPAAG